MNKHTMASGAFLVLMVLGACMNPLSEQPATGGGFTDTVSDGYGRVTVTLEGAGARTLFPLAADFGTVMLTFQGPEGAAIPEPIPVTGESATVDLALGAWTITATAYTNAAPIVAAAWGSAETTIKPKGNSTVSITLAPYMGEDAVQGTLRYTIGIDGDGGAIEQAGLSSATITITKINADGTDGEPDTTDLSWSVGIGRYADTISLDGGNYLVQVKLTRRDLSATRGWVAHLYPGLETRAACDFGELDLKPALMGTVSLGGSAVYGETLTVTPDLKGTGDLSYVWKRRDSAAGTDKVITSASGAAYTLTAADVGKYIAVEVSRKDYDGNKRAVTAAAVAKRPLTATATAANRPYDGTETVTVTITPENVVVGDDVTITGTGAADSADAGTGKAVTITTIALAEAAKNNYTAPAPESIKGVTVTIHKAAGAAVATPGGSCTGTTITVTALKVDNDGQEPEYAISTGDTAPADGWQKLPTFTGLTPGVTYYVYARAGASANYLVGEAVQSAAITVGKLSQAAFGFDVETVSKTYGDVPATYTARGGSGDGGISYAVTGGATVIRVDPASGVVSFRKAGTGYITATKEAADATYNPVTATLKVTVAKRLLTVTKVQAADRYYDGTTAVAVTITAGNVVGEEVSITAEGAVDKADADTDEKAVTISKITLIGGEAGNYTAPDSITGVTVTISKAPIIPVVTVASVTVPGKPDPQVSSGNPEGGTVSYIYAATVDGSYDNQVPTKAGKYWVKAAVAKTANYQSGVSAAVSFDIYPAGVLITAWVANHAIVTDAPGDGTVTLSRARKGGKAKTLTVKVEGGDYGTSYQWIIGGVVQERETAASYTFDSEHRDVGIYRLTLRVLKDGAPYTKTITIKVTE